VGLEIFSVTIKQSIGFVMVLIIMLCTLLGIGGVWGIIQGETAWQLFGTLVVVAIGLGTSGAMIDRFFKDSK
jgi:hypothetical protein